ncbi:MAG TPA: hypothetical protein VL651_15860, partial [Bacteroidia bacterium]|nr:hypothetical protein [Bacteroidia bacterium]
MIIGFLWLSYIDAHGLKVWITKAAVMLSVLGIINTAFLGILSLKPFSIPVLESSLKVCVQILMADVLFVVIRTQAEKMFYESDPGS